VCWFWDTSLFMISELCIIETSLFDFIVCAQRWSLQGIAKMKIFQSKACNYCKYISYNNIPCFLLPICCCLWIAKFHTNWQNNVYFVIETVCCIIGPGPCIFLLFLFPYVVETYYYKILHCCCGHYQQFFHHLPYCEKFQTNIVDVVLIVVIIWYMKE